MDAHNNYLKSINPLLLLLLAKKKIGEDYAEDDLDLILIDLCEEIEELDEFNYVHSAEDIFMKWRFMDIIDVYKLGEKKAEERMLRGNKDEKLRKKHSKLL